VGADREGVRVVEASEVEVTQDVRGWVGCCGVVLAHRSVSVSAGRGAAEPARRPGGGPERESALAAESFQAGRGCNAGGEHRTPARRAVCGATPQQSLPPRGRGRTRRPTPDFGVLTGVVHRAGAGDACAGRLNRGGTPQGWSRAP